ncbi:MAG: ABC transporter permease, partial [Dactylosporangium sp.]|nr:ABC transporter permease [Dactylosporangium sp.]
MSLAPAGGTAAAEAAEPQGTPAASSVDLAIVGRSPGQLAWARLRRDKVAMVSGTVMLILIVIALAAPLIEKLYGVGPNDFFKDDLDRYGMPYGVAGGISGTHWFGLEPGKGSDIFINLVYGMRTSLLIAFTAALITTVIGVVIGILAGYLGGWVDAVLGWVTDLFLALPFLIFTLTLVRPLELHFYGPRDAVPSWFRITILIGLFAVFGWTSTA